MAVFTNAKLFLPGKGFVPGGFRAEGGRFADIYPAGESPAGALNLQGARVIPGLVDIHTHGAAGADISDGDGEGLRRMAAHLAKCGVTSFAPTTMTLPYETLAAAFQTAMGLAEDRPADCARVMGIHMEGPFFSEKKKGAQNGAYLKFPDFEAFRALYEICGGLVRIVDVAPELPGAAAFTGQAKALCTVSVAHTDADYEKAKAVFQAGATHLTHLYNAMPPIHHRPGVIGAASEQEDVKAELICDGLHVHPSAVRMAFRLFPGPLYGHAKRCLVRHPCGRGRGGRDAPPCAGDRPGGRDRLDRGRKACRLRRLRRRPGSLRGLHRRRESLIKERGLSETAGQARTEDTAIARKRKKSLAPSFLRRAFCFRGSSE